MNLSNRDKKIMWHPFTQEKTADLPIAVKRAKGSYLFDEDGNGYLDLISSWWTNLHGHAHPQIAESIYKQALELEHVMFAGFTHEPAVKLCEMLQELLPNKLSRFFFSDNGSTSVECALKMAYQYWYNSGYKERKLFLSFEGGYHGDTFGAMSVGRTSGFYEPFQDFLFRVLTVPYAAIGGEIKEEEALEALEKYLEQSGEQIAAFIMEPLIQGASGMRICRPEFLREVLKRVRKYGILVIYDEVMTGFGRTGTYFALEQIGEVPDFLCLSKGITGGFLPLALTVTTEEIYEAFLNEKWQYAFLHGHTYTANPLACAAAIASLNILKSEETQNAIKQINQTHNEYVYGLSDVTNPRVLGAIAAFETIHAKELKSKCLKEGMLIRPLGNTVYILPPYSIEKSELQNVYERLNDILLQLIS